MTTTDLIQQLTNLAKPVRTSEAANRGAMNEACRMVRNSNLSDSDKQSVIAAIRKAANPTGWYHVENGIREGIDALEALIKAAQKDESKVSLFKQAHALTKQTVQSGDSYQVTFAACLKQLYQNLRYGMIMFIASEVMFFVAWFWAFFEYAIFHEVRLDPGLATWPPAGVRP